jgi:hypothetical protein
MIDHRASPGTPTVPEGYLFEAPTYTCAHCQFIVVMEPRRERAREVCLKCMAIICDPCHAVGECTPFLKLAEDAADALYHAETNGLLLPR